MKIEFPTFDLKKITSFKWPQMKKLITITSNTLDKLETQKNAISPVSESVSTTVKSSSVTRSSSLSRQTIPQTNAITTQQKQSKSVSLFRDKSVTLPTQTETQTLETMKEITPLLTTQTKKSVLFFSLIGKSTTTILMLLLLTTLLKTGLEQLLIVSFRKFIENRKETTRIEKNDNVLSILSSTKFARLCHYHRYVFGYFSKHSDHPYEFLFRTFLNYPTSCKEENIIVVKQAKKSQSAIVGKKSHSLSHSVAAKEILTNPGLEGVKNKIINTVLNIQSQEVPLSQQVSGTKVEQLVDQALKTEIKQSPSKKQSSSPVKQIVNNTVQEVVHEAVEGVPPPPPVDLAIVISQTSTTEKGPKSKTTTTTTTATKTPSVSKPPMPLNLISQIQKSGHSLKKIDTVDTQKRKMFDELMKTPLRLGLFEQSLKLKGLLPEFEKGTMEDKFNIWLKHQQGALESVEETTDEDWET